MHLAAIHLFFALLVVFAQVKVPVFVRGVDLVVFCVQEALQSDFSEWS